MNILVVGAHPDDIEFGCAPVVIKEIKKGNCAKLLVLSRGEAGSSGTPEGREWESRQAARLMGAAAIEFLDFGGDSKIENSPANRLRIAAEIRSFQPEIVLAPHIGENQHPDHAVVGKLTRDACPLARYGGLEDLKPQPAHRVSSLYYYNITQHSGQPDVVVDIGDVMADWEAAMRCHDSQVTYKRYIDLQKTAARLLGISIGADYAIGLYVNDPVRLDALSDLSLSSRNF
jgi:bacillithiol biosynthesis deacetylase BshB1